MQILIERTQVDPAAPDAPAPAIETDPDLIIQVAAIAQTSMFRLEAFEAYGAERFADLTVRTTALGVRADRDVSHWIMLLVLVSGASVFFLGLMLWTTVRPLRRLTSRALDVGRGEIPSGPLRVTGRRTCGL